MSDSTRRCGDCRGPLGCSGPGVAGRSHAPSAPLHASHLSLSVYLSVSQRVTVSQRVSVAQRVSVEQCVSGTARVCVGPAC